MVNCYFVEVELLKPDEDILNSVSRYSIESHGKSYPMFRILHYHGSSFFVHYKEAFSMFSFFILNRIEREKVHMSQLDHKIRDVVLDDLQQSGMIRIIGGFNG